MADFSSIFAPDPCCYLANSGGTNILLCCERDQCGCGERGGRSRCKRRKCSRRGRCDCR